MMCKVIRSECLRQARIYKDALHIRLQQEHGRSHLKRKKWRDLCGVIECSLESAWRRQLLLRSHTPPGRCTELQALQRGVHSEGHIEGFVDLGDHTPADQKNVLGDHGMVMLFQPFTGAEELIGVTQPTLSNIIHEVAEAIIVLGKRRKLVDFALTPAAKVELKAGFARRGAIPGVLACVDGTLVAIQKPEGLSIADTASFMTRKGYYALNGMVVCDADFRILVIDPPFSGVMPRLLGVEAQPTVEVPRLQNFSLVNMYLLIGLVHQPRLRLKHALLVSLANQHRLRLNRAILVCLVHRTALPALTTACHAVLHLIVDISFHGWPPYVAAGEFLAPYDTWMSPMYLFQDCSFGGTTTRSPSIRHPSWTVNSQHLSKQFRDGLIRDRAAVGISDRKLSEGMWLDAGIAREKATTKARQSEMVKEQAPRCRAAKANGRSRPGS
ncbi:hypothetical protein MTO96_029632 [Rhipicephalus appendiculatus]